MPIADVLSGGKRGRVWRRWAFGAASLLVHAGLLAALEAALGERDDRVVFVDGSERLTYGAVVLAIDEARKVAELQSIGLVPRSERERIGRGAAP